MLKMLRKRAVRGGHKAQDQILVYETLQDHCLIFALYGVVEGPPPSITLVKLVRGVSNLSIGPLSNSP